MNKINRPTTTQANLYSDSDKRPDLKTVMQEPEGTYNKLSKETFFRIEDFKRWMQQKRYSSSTIKVYVSFILKFFGSSPQCEWNEVTKEKLSAYSYTHFIEGSLSYSAQNQWISAFKLFTKFVGLEIDNIDLDISRPKKKMYLPDVLSREEVKLIFTHTRNMKHRILLMIIYSTGMRIGEVLKLQLNDINSGESLIYIRQAKGGKDRRLPLSDFMLEKLRNYYRVYTPSLYLFEGQTARKPYTRASASKFLKRALESSGIKKRVTLHTLRHSYATHLTQKGINIQYIQQILGHKSPKTTMIYTHLSGVDLKILPDPLEDLGL